MDYLLRKAKEAEAKLAAEARAHKAKPAPEVLAPAPAHRSHAVEDLVSRHQDAKALLLNCLSLHDAERGQHSSDLLIATSNIKIAAKRANRANASSPYLEAVCAAIASDCEQCHQLLQRKRTAQKELDDAAAAKLQAMQVVIQPYPLTAGTYAPVTADEVNVIVGLRAVEPDRIALIRSLKGGTLAEFWWVRLPSAAPYIFAGMKTSIVLALLGAIAAEFVGAEAGLGYLMTQLMFKLDTPGVFAILIILSIIGVTLYMVADWAQRKIVFWDASTVDRWKSR